MNPRRCPRAARSGLAAPLLRSPSVPLAFQRRCQTLTAWAETPSRRATSAWWTPAANNSAARSRRASKRSRSRCAAGQRGRVGMPRILTRRAAWTPTQPDALNPTPQDPLVDPHAWHERSLLHRGAAGRHKDGRRTGPGGDMDDRSGRAPGRRGRCLAVGAGQLVAAMVVRQSLSRLWVPHSSFHSAWQARSPRRMNRPPPCAVLTCPKTGSMVRPRWA
jgi:hypothetical protein